MSIKVLFYLIKVPVAIVLSPVLWLLFKLDPIKLFLPVFTFLWPHLDVLDEDGLYLRRFFMTPKTQWYHPRFLHYIAKSDKGRLVHDHPGAFSTKILHNGYFESVAFPFNQHVRIHYPLFQVRKVVKGMTQVNPVGHTHKVDLIGPTISWVKGWKRGKPWYFYDLHPTDASKDIQIESNVYTSKGKEICSWK